MDTRAKILTRPAALDYLPRLGPCTKVSGYFDPLLASHARRLESVRSAGVPLVVLVNDPPAPLLPARARAELVAALGAVEVVVLPEGPSAADLVPELRMEEVDEADRNRLICAVKERHR